MDGPRKRKPASGCLSLAAAKWQAANPTIKKRSATGASACKCSKSRCLKLYCDCFRQGKICRVDCACQNCLNTGAHDGTDGLRSQAIGEILARREDAFEPRQRNVEDGCRCKKTRCLKKYCICFNRGAECDARCRCEDCGNRTGRDAASPAHAQAEGCRCKRTRCLKKYCICFKRGAECGARCRCEGCKNRTGRDGAEEDAAPSAKTKALAEGGPAASADAAAARRGAARDPAAADIDAFLCGRSAAARAAVGRSASAAARTAFGVTAAMQRGVACTTAAGEEGAMESGQEGRPQQYDENDGLGAVERPTMPVHASVLPGPRLSVQLSASVDPFGRPAAIRPAVETAAAASAAGGSNGDRPAAVSLRGGRRRTAGSRATGRRAGRGVGVAVGLSAFRGLRAPHNAHGTREAVTPAVTGRWTVEEHRLFLQGLETHGKGWKKITALIESRTVDQVRTHAQKYFQKLAKARQDGEVVADVPPQLRGGQAVPGRPMGAGRMLAPQGHATLHSVMPEGGCP